MSEWIRHRGSKSMPKRLDGVRFEVRQRNGVICELKGEPYCVKHSVTWQHASHDRGNDIMAYRVIGEIATPDYTNGYPEGTTAADIGAKVGDEFVVIKEGTHGFKIGEVVTLDGDIERDHVKFIGEDDYWWCYFHELAPLPPKSAIETHPEEVGIPEPVNVEQIDTSPERVEIEQENVHITPETLTPRDIAPALKAAGVTIKLEDDPRTAPAFLQSARQTLTQRGKDYDKPEGERSASAVAVAFNAITGRNITEAEVWLVLQLVKDVRQWQNPGRYHADSALDCVAYAALKAEALAKGG